MPNPTPAPGPHKRNLVTLAGLVLICVVGVFLFYWHDGSTSERADLAAPQSASSPTPGPGLAILGKDKAPAWSRAPTRTGQPASLHGGAGVSGGEPAKWAFAPEDIAAARLLEPQPPRSVEWDDSCRPEELPPPSAVAAFTPDSMAADIKRAFRAQEEFPTGVHLVRWEMAFGLPDTGVVLWAEWLGTRPSTYRVLVQDSRQPRKTWDARGMAPVATLQSGVTWQEAQTMLAAKKQELGASLGEPNYRRLIATTETDDFAGTGSESSHSETPAREIAGVEMLGARVLAYSRGPTSCLRRDDNAMVCFCGKGGHDGKGDPG